MKIVAIIGSPSPHGNTAVLVRAALRGAAQRGAETEEVHLLSYNLQFCRGCMTCLAKGRCSLPDELEEIKDKINEADGIIFGAPTYGLEPNAIMKNFLDRIGLLGAYASSLGGKYVVGISTAGAMGARGVAKKLVGLANGCFERGYVSGTYGVSLGWHTVENYPKYIRRAEQLGAKLVGDIAAQRTFPWQNILGQLINALAVRPAITKNIESHKTNEMQAVYNSLVKRKLWKLDQ